MNTAKKSKNAFSPWQLTVITIVAGMGGMYFYPRDFSRSSLLLLAAAVILTLISVAMFAHSFSRSESVSFPNLLEENLGGIPARIILAAAAVYFIAEICGITVRQTQMTGLFLLEKTPPQVIAAVTLATSAFIIYSGIRQISRTAELLFFFIMLPLTFILIMALLGMDYGELIPMLSPTSVNAEQITSSLLPLGGITAAAYFAGYYDKGKNARSLVSGAGILGIFAIVVLISCVGIFSVGGTKHLAFPLAELSRVAGLGNIALTERFDILYMIIYTASTILSSGILYYCCCISLCGVFGIKSHKCFIFILLPIIFLLSYYGLNNIEFIERITAWGKIIFLFVLIPLLFIVSCIRGKGRRSAV